MDTKRILAIILFIAVTLGIGAALYLFFFRAATPGPVVNAPGVNVSVNGGGLIPSVNGGPVPGTNVNGGVLPGQPVAPQGPSEVADGGITVVTPVSTTPTVGADISSTGQVNYYNRTDGKFYRLQADGSVSALSEKAFYNVQQATFDPAGGKAILEYPDGSNIVYDFNRAQQVTLPKHWEGFAFSPTGDQIASKSIALDPGSRFLVVSDADGGNARPVQELGENGDKVKVDWSPNNQVIATATTGQKLGVDRHEVYFLGQNGENFKSMVVEGLDFRPKWTPQGDRLLYSAAGSGSDWKPQLWIVDAQGDSIGANRRSISINTWVDKCTFADDDTVYCAVPQELPRGAGLQPSIADGVTDDIYRIDLTTGLQTRIATPEGGHSIEKIMLSPSGDTLYFTDMGSGILNTMKLQE